MTRKKITLCAFTATFFFSISTFADVSKPMPIVENSIENPCEVNILSALRRPTISTSACTTPVGKAIFESGVEYVDIFSGGHGYIYPQIKARAGLPGHNEIAIFMPNEMSNSQKRTSGLSFTQLAFKHNLGYTDHWIASVRGIFIPASGSKNFGTADAGFTLNGVLAYRIENFNISLMLGESSFSTSIASGGKRFTTFSPDLTLGWQMTTWLQPYAEVYGQNHTGPKQGVGYNLDTGLIFLLNRYFEADVEIGKRLSGKLGNINTYYGAGFSFMV